MINGHEITDFHAHILPGADHGSRGIDDTLGQIALMNNAGVDTVVATPHFYPNRHTLEYFLGKVETSEEKIRSLEIPRPKICLGAEVLYCEGLEHMNDLKKLCIRGTNLLLLELPLDTWDTRLFDTVSSLLKEYTVVLAHIDRYIVHQMPEIDRLLDMGALAQINAQSLFYRPEMRYLSPFIENGCISALGSDMHNSDKKKIAKRFMAAHKKLGDEYFKIMERAAELLKGAERI